MKPSSNEIWANLYERYTKSFVDHILSITPPIPTLVFDLETLNLAQEVGGWWNKPGMGIACLVIFETSTSQWHIFTDADYNAALSNGTIEEFRNSIREIFDRNPVQVSFNGAGFDYRVIQAWFDPLSLEFFHKYEPTIVDPCYELYRKHNSFKTNTTSRISLKSLSKQLHLPNPKAMHGVDAVFAWREGGDENKRNVIKYCSTDVFGTLSAYAKLVTSHIKFTKGVAEYSFRFFNSIEVERRLFDHPPERGLISNCRGRLPKVLSDHLYSRRKEFKKPVWPKQPLLFDIPKTRKCSNK